MSLTTQGIQNKVFNAGGCKRLGNVRGVLNGWKERFHVCKPVTGITHLGHVVSPVIFQEEFILSFAKDLSEIIEEFF